MGDAAKIRASVVRKQKTDARDAEHLLDLLRQDRFPQIWRPSPAERDLRQLIWHRQKLVWMCGAVKNQLHALAMGEGCAARRSCSPRKVARNWKIWRWDHGPGIGGKSCCGCSMSSRQPRRTWIWRWSRQRRQRKAPDRSPGLIANCLLLIAHRSTESIRRCRHSAPVPARSLPLLLPCRLAPDSTTGHPGRCGLIRGLWLRPCG